MGPFPNDKKMPRLSVGDPTIDDWIDGLVSTVERNSNISATGGIQARVGPAGISLSLAGNGSFAWAMSGASGITGNKGKADVTLQDWNGSNFDSQGVTVEAINIGSDAVGASKLILLALVGKYYFVIWENCT